MICLLACRAAVEPGAPDPQPLDAPFGDVVAVLPTDGGHVVVTATGAVRIATDGRVSAIAVPPGAPITAAAMDAEGLLVARGPLGELPGGGALGAVVHALAPGVAAGAGGALARREGGPWQVVAAPGARDAFLFDVVRGGPAVGGAPGPHGGHDGRIVTPDGERWLGGPSWEVLHAIVPSGDGWLVAGAGDDVRGGARVSGALWVARLDASLAPVWERRVDGGYDHVAALVGLEGRAVLLALGGAWDDPRKPLVAWTVTDDGRAWRFADLGPVRSVAAAAAGPDAALVATTMAGPDHAVRWLAAPPACPPDDLVGALHDATFRFEHGDAALAREALGRARALGPADEVGARVLARLGEIAADPGAGDRIARTEELRAVMTDWPCLRPDLHERLHAALPPIADPF